MRIGPVETRERVLVVAEIGNNHEGSPKLAARLVQLAADCGADAVKFQTFRTEAFLSPSDSARFARLHAFELAPEEFVGLALLARSLGLGFLSTPLDLGSARTLESTVDAFKIASSDVSFHPLLETVAQSGKPVLLSTGLSDLDEVQNSVDFIRAAWQRTRVAGELAVLHCVTAYPVPAEEAGLNAIGVLRDRFGSDVGYSDHTIGIEAAVLAVAAGARIIEKHFTIDKQYSEFRDHQLSADPTDLKELVTRVRAAETMLGPREKRVQPSAAGATVVLRRSISAATALPRGHRVSAADLIWLRPGGGLPVGHEHKVIGKTLCRAVSAGERLTLADLSDD